jgi:polyferredoxin
MRLTWRDGGATVMAGLVVAVTLAVTRSWDWPMLGSYRAGVGALGVIGLSMCIFGSSRTKPSFNGPFVVFASALGGLALVLIIVGLVTGTETPLVLLAVVIEILWAATTLRHAVSARQAGPRRRALMA